MIGHYKKAIAGVVGLALMLLNRYTGVDLMGIEPTIIDLALAGLTGLGVYGLRNEPMENGGKDEHEAGV